MLFGCCCCCYYCCCVAVIIVVVLLLCCCVCWPSELKLSTEIRVALRDTLLQSWSWIYCLINSVYVNMLQIVSIFHEYFLWSCVFCTEKADQSWHKEDPSTLSLMQTTSMQNAVIADQWIRNFVADCFNFPWMFSLKLCFCTEKADQSWHKEDPSTLSLMQTTSM